MKLDIISLSCFAYILQKVDPKTAAAVLKLLFIQAMKEPDPFFVYDNRGRPTHKTTVLLRHPGDPRVLSGVTDGKGIAIFGPLNPAFYFAEIKDGQCIPVRIYVAPEKTNVFRIEK